MSSGDRYELQQLLGRGGMAEVYRAYDHIAEMDVALKILHRHLADDEAMVEAFEREASLMQQLDHPGIVRVYALTEFAGRPAISMELLRGGELRQRLLRRERFDEDRAREITLFVLEALACAHEEGIVHRDVKPQNVLFDEEDNPRLIDFGIGQAQEVAEAQAAGQVGTVEYMAPERIDGFAVDARSDVYSVGIMLFELVCGHVPYRADSAAQVMRMHRDAPIPDPGLFAAQISDELKQIIQVAMAKHPEERFDDARSMSEALRGEEHHRCGLDEHPLLTELTSRVDEDAHLRAAAEADEEWVIYLDKQQLRKLAEDHKTIDLDSLRHLLTVEYDRHLLAQPPKIREKSVDFGDGGIIDSYAAYMDASSLWSQPSTGAHWSFFLRFRGLVRGLSTQGLDELMSRLYEINLLPTVGRRSRSHQLSGAEKALSFLPTVFVGRGLLLAGIIFLGLFGSLLLIELGLTLPVVFLYLSIWVLAGIEVGALLRHGQLRNAWIQQYTPRYVLDFRRTLDRRWVGEPVGPEHLELMRSIQSPRIAASYRRAISAALHLRDILRQRELPGEKRVFELTERAYGLGERIVALEEQVATERPTWLASRIRQLDRRLDVADDVDEARELMEKKHQLRRRIEARDQARQHLQSSAQRLLDLSGQLEQMVQAFDGESTAESAQADTARQIDAVVQEVRRLVQDQ